jgi:hypothetical protein
MRPMIPLLMLVACTMPPQAQPEPAVLPIIVVEEAHKKEEPKPAHIKPKVEKKPEDKKADKVCPPVEGETDSQRIIRKLDCLIERD